MEKLGEKKKELGARDVCPSFDICEIWDMVMGGGFVSDTWISPFAMLFFSNPIIFTFTDNPTRTHIIANFNVLECVVRSDISRHEIQIIKENAV